MSKTTKIVLAIVGGVLLFGILACVGLIGLGWYVVSSVEEAENNVAIQVDAPLSVKVGEPVTITVTVTNLTDEQQNIVAIDFAKDYTEGIAIQSATPGWTGSTDIFVATSYDFKVPVLVNNSPAVVTFQGTAVKAGDFSGDLDISINEELSFQTHSLRTIVQP